ncbi:MAG: biotin--[Oscillospiraceae bacterium]|nr:biotin--[acetyl-CoA-carboxylase] ligase [Oscillospiraceae bacterium]
TIDSTNSFLKREAADGAPHGSVAVANCQSAGRGRLGRSFQSPPDKGIYLSVLLRPNLPGDALLSATGLAAVAVSRAVQRTSGARVGIKWTNDLILGGRKLAGILAETVVIGREIALVIGVGVNVHHGREDFQGEVADIATSLAIEGFAVERAALAAAMIEELYALGDALGGEIGDYLEEYRRRCVTLGREVRLMWSEEQSRAAALDIDEQFGLVVRMENGTVTTVRTGEVSVRGLYGYTE